jgi:hypothetical protein
MGRHQHLVAASLAGAILTAGPSPAVGDERLEVAGFLGASTSFGNGVDLSQAGHPTIHASGTYASRSFEFPLYYAVRFSWLRDALHVELQLVHHKLLLIDPPAEVQQFEISHGFNLLTVNYVSHALPVDLRLGVGVVLAHPESIVRGQVGPEGGGVFGSGYHLTGPAFVLGSGRAFSVAPRLVLLPEVFLSAARARVSVAGGEASLFDVALHGLLGVGFRF